MTTTAPRPQAYDTLIFDMGDVLFTWSAETNTSISAPVLRRILQTATWFQYEKGQIAEADCYAAVGKEIGLDSKEIAAAFRAARDSLTSRSPMFDLVRELKPGRKIYAMSNISAPDYEALRAKPFEWDLFDRIFASAAARRRKPEIGFYRHVLEQTGADPQRIIMVDDKLENLITARSFGIQTVLYDNFANVERSLRNLCGNPVHRGEAFLRAHAKNHLSYTSTDQVMRENFTQLLILEATNDPSLVEYTKYEGPFNFYERGELTTLEFPFDVDTTSIGLTISDHLDPSIKNRVMDEIVELRNSDNVVPVYFDARRPRVDPVVCVNALALFYANGRGEQLAETLDWVHGVLQYRAYEDGTRYYVSAEAFLFFVSRLLDVAPQLRPQMGRLLAERARERVGAHADALALAMRIIVCIKERVDPHGDVRTLLHMQETDGAWTGWFYKIPSLRVSVANRGLTTALAVKALEMATRGGQ